MKQTTRLKQAYNIVVRTGHFDTHIVGILKNATIYENKLCKK